MTEIQDHFTTSEAALALRVTPETIHAWRRRGHILAVELPNGRFIIPATEIDRLQNPDTAGDRR